VDWFEDGIRDGYEFSGDGGESEFFWFFVAEKVLVEVF